MVVLVAMSNQARDRALALEQVVQPALAVDVVVREIELGDARIDMVINNAGVSQDRLLNDPTKGPITADYFNWHYTINVLAPLLLTQAVAPHLPTNRSGRIVNISSVAGFTASAGRGVYGASKFAVEAITEALHGELAPFGVHVTAVEPGSFRTDFLSAESRRRPAAGIPVYADTVGALLDTAEARSGAQPGDPERAVRAVRELLTVVEPPVRLPLGSDCVGLVDGKLTSVAKELDQWRELALSTDF